MQTHRVLLFILAAALFAFATGCETPRQRAQVLASVRVEVGTGDGAWDRGGKDIDTDSQWFAVSWAPFAALEAPREVVVVSTHAAAEAGCEGPK